MLYETRSMKYQPIIAFRRPKTQVIGCEALYNSCNNYRLFQGGNLQLERDCLFSAITEVNEYDLMEDGGRKLFVNASMGVIKEYYAEICDYVSSLMLSGQVVVEITEQPYYGSMSEINRIIEKMRQRGVLSAIDDFGAGHSYKLQGFNVDFVKIDIDLVRNCQYSLRKQTILKQIVSLYGESKVIAEGVETLDECETCRNVGISLMQGYYFAYPVPLPDFRKYCLATDEGVSCLVQGKE